jgi:hypothetical protein
MQHAFFTTFSSFHQFTLNQKLLPIFLPIHTLIQFLVLFNGQQNPKFGYKLKQKIREKGEAELQEGKKIFISRSPSSFLTIFNYLQLHKPVTTTPQSLPYSNYLTINHHKSTSKNQFKNKIKERKKKY